MTITTPIVLTVSQLTQAIKLQLESTFPHVLLKGEISNLKVQTSGHMYFSLKDEQAQIACVMFRLDLMKVQVPLKVGDQVIVKGEISVFAPKGSYQLIVREITLLGLGELLYKLEQLKQKLHGLGWFDPARKKRLPLFPKRIGVVTSPTGAVIRDIIHVLTRRLKGFHLILNPVRVQGEGAAEEIAAAIHEFNQYDLADVIIVGRGGGSVEDLMPFNDEKVAAAIFKSKIPIISAVGHETDTSISDFVADVRAPTPSAAAEIVSFEQHEVLLKLSKAQKHIQQIVVNAIISLKQKLNRIGKHPLFHSSEFLLRESMQQLDGCKELFEQHMRSSLSKWRSDYVRLKRLLEAAKPEVRYLEQKKRLLALEKNLNTAMGRTLLETKKRFLNKHFESQLHHLCMREILQKKMRLTQLTSHLQSVNPKSLLQKGYSIVFSEKDNSVISSIKNVAKGLNVKLLFADGEATAEVETIKPYDNS